MGSRFLVCLGLAACAGDNKLDPSQLELRDLLGVAPETAMAWDGGQREAARHVIDAALHEPTLPSFAPIGRQPTVERSISIALAAADTVRAKAHQPAMGVVQLVLDPNKLSATSRPSTLTPHAKVEISLAGWDRPGWSQLPARGLDVLSTIATDAGHKSGPLLVTPAPQLAVIAGYIPATATEKARLVVNPVLLASLEPTAKTPVLGVDTIGNPYTFYSSIAECAAAQAARCEACTTNNTCSPVAGIPDCSELAANDGRGYALACINVALEIQTIETCAASKAPSCPINPHASALDNNSDFLDRMECAGPLDSCLANVFGPATPTVTPTTSSPSCSDTACGDSPGCDDVGCDGGDCSDDSNTDDSSCDSGDDSSSCDSGDSGGDCSGGDSGCSGGDSGCSGDGGGDCSGGGDDCNAGGHHDHSLLWACLPIPFAIIARRRADRKKAQVSL